MRRCARNPANLGPKAKIAYMLRSKEAEQRKSLA